ncbi:DNA translocase FtsK [Solibacillus sp. CAU 1738]|uniref:DNA translocase FtsK n=1 Tax=Solibacillus sp. CAU 1738 TaxID=3140363 RepID=UPI003260FAC4
MNWFKKQINKLLYIDEEEQEEQFEAFETEEEERVEIHKQTQQSSFRFPLISDEEVVPQPQAQPKQSAIVSENSDSFELPKYLQKSNANVYDVEVSGIRDLLERRKKGRGYSQVIRSSGTERRPEMKKDETELLSKKPIRSQKEVNEEFVNPLQKRKRFVPTNVPSPVYGFAKPKPIEELLPKKEELKQEMEETAVEPFAETSVLLQEVVEIPVILEQPIVEEEVPLPQVMKETVQEKVATIELFEQEQAPKPVDVNKSYYENTKQPPTFVEDLNDSGQLSEVTVEHLTIENSTIHIGHLNVDQAQQNEMFQIKSEETAATQSVMPSGENSTGSRLPFNVLMLKSDKQKLIAKQMVKDLFTKQVAEKKLVDDELQVHAEVTNETIEYHDDKPDINEQSTHTIDIPSLTISQQPQPFTVVEKADAVEDLELIKDESDELPENEVIEQLATFAKESNGDGELLEVHRERIAQVDDETVQEEKANEQTSTDSRQSSTFYEKNEAEHVQQLVQKEIKQYDKPSMSFLSPPEEKIADLDWMEEQAEALVEALSYHQVTAQIESIMQGPAVTQFEITIGHGTKVSKIRNLSDDLKLALAAKDIRIQAPIPGKRTIGIEIPNLTSRAVRLSEVTDSAAFLESDSPMEAALGLDLTGKPVTIDLRKMPHGLIAGATGSGKSVCINSILVSLLYKADPHELKLMLIDPKMVELAPFNHIPHLVSPVITDVKAAAAALKWAVEEMERRYQLFMHAEVRDITRFNAIAEANGQYAQKLPYLLIVIDELADLMMMAPADVEDAICRIAQKARACGIHLIVATQRPSVDVITGLIKANIPTRIAFSVSSQIDSRTILDIQGAERLLGRGDMLYLGNGMSAPQRIQGTFVTDDEIENIISYVRSQGEPDYIFEQEELLKKVEMVEEQDELFEEVCRFVYEQGTASTSSIQRKYHIGYNRAARLVDMLEKHGFVSEQRGSKPRESFITESDLVSMFE